MKLNKAETLLRKANSINERQQTIKAKTGAERTLAALRERQALIQPEKFSKKKIRIR